MARHLNWIGAAAAALSLAGCSYLPPDCDAPELVKSVTDVVNGNEEVKGLALSVKEIRGLKETARDETKNTRACAPRGGGRRRRRGRARSPRRRALRQAGGRRGGGSTS